MKDMLKKREEEEEEEKKRLLLKINANSKRIVI